MQNQRLLRLADRAIMWGAKLGSHRIEVLQDLRIPMDDGVELLADLVRPRVPPAQPLPTVVIRGPYGRSGLLGGDARILAYEGFTVVFQSCRGTHGSGGVFTPQVDEERDGVATHRWIRRQPWFTGRSVTFGGSYLGYTQWAVLAKLIREDPAAAPEASALLVTTPNFGEATWQNGSFALRNALSWTAMMDRTISGRGSPLAAALPSRKVRKAFGVLPLSRGDTAATGHPVGWYQDWVEHEDLSEGYWTQQSHTTSVPEVTVPVFMGTGWYDIFLPWQLRSYALLVAAGHQPTLTIGPTGHNLPGSVLAESIAFLKHQAPPPNRPTPVRAYLTGARRWHNLQAWPPAGVVTQDLFLHPDATLSMLPATGGSTAYSYDPDDPTPALGGPALSARAGPRDNRRHERRRDVVAFRSAPLTAAVVVAGEPLVRVGFRSTANSYDVFARLTDVHPDGRVMTVCDGIRRVGSHAADGRRFRQVDVTLWPTFHEFRPGHRIGVQISSGAHPRYARNPGTGLAASEATDTVVAHQEISHASEHGSLVRLPVWIRSAI